MANEVVLHQHEPEEPREIGPDDPMLWSEYVAMRFHQAYEELAPLHGYETRRESAVPWAEVPQQNRDLMVDVVRHLRAGGVIRA